MGGICSDSKESTGTTPGQKVKKGDIKSAMSSPQDPE